MRWFVAVLIAAVAAPAAAQNWVRILKNTPAERFDEEDLRLFLDNGRKALAEGKVNETSSWENPKTRARGEITVLRNYESKGRPCRDVRMYNEAQGRKNTSELSLCQVEGKWRLVTAPQPKK
jgi:surface antigen